MKTEKREFVGVSYKKTIEIIAWVVRLVFKFGPKTLTVIFILQLLATTIPFAEQKLLSDLIDSLVLSATTKNNYWVYIFSYFLAIRLAKTILLQTWWMLSRLFEIRMQENLLKLYITKISSYDYQQFEDESIAKLKSKVDEEYHWRTRQMVNDIFDLITQLISFTTVLILLIPRYWYMAILLLIGELPGVLVDKRWQKSGWRIFNFYNEKTRPGWDIAWQLVNKKYIAELKIMKAIDWLRKKMIDGQKEFTMARIKDRKAKYWPDILSANFSIIIGGLCMILIIKDINAGWLTIGMFTFYFNIIRSTGDYFAGILNRFISISEQALYIDNFKKLIELPKVLIEGKINKGLNKDKEIKFVNVSFKYPNSSKYIFKDLNLTIKPGEEIALVGKNGAGKSTLIKLLCRFYDPSQGKITVNGINLKDIDINYWYKQISLLTQEFNTYDNLNLADNVSIGKPRNNAKIIKALQRAEAWDLVTEYKQGLETMMSQRYGGVEPSWGQWQKIAIARLFYHNSPIMVLDEPTASIDAMAEAKIFSRLYKQVKGKTLIIVSHRFSTVRNAQRILVIDKGQIIEEGDHQQLIEKNGLYARSFKLQAEGYN